MPDSNNSSAVQQLTHALIHLDGVLAPNTLRAYRADALNFIRWCESHQCTPFPASVKTLSGFISYRIEHANIFSLKRQIAGIHSIHQTLGVPSNARNPEVTLLLKKLSRIQGEPQQQATGMTEVILHQLIAVTDSTKKGYRDRALLRLAYESMRRRDELVKFQVSDLTFRADGTGILTLQRSKTDQIGTGFLIALSVPCMDALLAWFEIAEIQDGPILRSVKKGGKVVRDEGLDSRSIGRIYHWLAEKAGITKAERLHLSAHSTRVGPAQELLRRGETIPQIMRRGGWKSARITSRYTRHADLEPLPF